jgi:hypothetical protein
MSFGNLMNCGHEFRAELTQTEIAVLSQHVMMEWHMRQKHIPEGRRQWQMLQYAR